MTRGESPFTPLHICLHADLISASNVVSGCVCVFVLGVYRVDLYLTKGVRNKTNVMPVPKIRDNHERARWWWLWGLSCKYGERGWGERSISIASAKSPRLPPRGGERDRGVVDVWATTKLRRDLKQKHIAICLRIIFGVEFVYRMMLTHTRIYVLARYQQRERQTEAGEHTFVSVCCAGVQVMRDGCEVWGGEGDIRCGMRSVSRWWPKIN